MTTSTAERPRCHCGSDAVIIIRLKPYEKGPRLDGQPGGTEPYDQPSCQRHVTETCKVGTVLRTTPLDLRS